MGADDAQRPSSDADDAAMVSPVVLAQRKRRADAQNPPAVTPRDGAMSWEKRNNSLEDLRKQLRQRPAPVASDSHVALVVGTGDADLSDG